MCYQLFQDASELNDYELLSEINNGSYKALDTLIRKHQGFIYNISLRMVGNVHDAEDMTQEILIKVVTNLSSFSGESQFSTWLYRIVTNHVLNHQRKQKELLFKDFKTYRGLIDSSENVTLSQLELGPAEYILDKEVRTECMMGMLLCLDRRQRLAFILGGIFAIDSDLGARLMNIRRANFRKVLSRAREQLKSFMMGECSLMNPSGTCKCIKKVGALIKAGHVNPDDLTFEQDHVISVKAYIEANIHKTRPEYMGEVDQLFQNHPYMNGPDFMNALKESIHRIDADWQSI